MSIQSPYFFLFVGLLWLAAWRLRTVKVRQVLLLAASYLFYASVGRWFVAVLIASTVVNYAWGEVLRRRPSAGRLWAGIVINLLPLIFFKYLPEVSAASQGAGSFLAHIVMPVGISFWTFQALSYLFDLYREEELTPTLPEFSLYMAFWPTVLSGPVCRLPEMLPQFRSDRRPSRADVWTGIQRIALGLFMKVVLAQLLAEGLIPAAGVNAGFGLKSGWGGFDVWILAVGFGFELYFDFAGYSNIVIGAARLFGFVLPENFENPYLSLTPSAFWTRWHMSLSFWIRDYLFLPLAMLRREIWWRNAALIIAMVLFGLWHKGALLFAAWGLYQGVLLVIHRLGQQAKRRWDIQMPARAGTFLAWLATFSAISLGWVLFRASTPAQAAAMLHAVVSPASYAIKRLPAETYRIVLLLAVGYFVVCGVMAAMTRWYAWAADEVSTKRYVEAWIRFAWDNRWWLLAPALGVLIGVWALANYLHGAGSSAFIYTNF
jgi:alginate O-acetyltransferase complex protein AlgI